MSRSPRRLTIFLLDLVDPESGHRWHGTHPSLPGCAAFASSYADNALEAASAAVSRSLRACSLAAATWGLACGYSTACFSPPNLPDQPLLRVADCFFLSTEFRNNGLPCLISNLPRLRFPVSAFDPYWLLQRILFRPGYGRLRYAASGARHNEPQILRPPSSLLLLVFRFRQIVGQLRQGIDLNGQGQDPPL